MVSFVFLLGRPGCGKSAVYRILSERIKERGLAEDTTRIDDFPILEKFLEEDENRDKHLEKEGGFEVTDLSLLDDVLKKINKKLKDLKRTQELVFVEFSRASYRRAMKNFDPEVLEDSLIVYIYCPFEICLQRNKERFERGAEEADDHIVPVDMMESYYKGDDYEELFLDSKEKLHEATPTDTVVIRNDYEGLDRLKKELDRAIEGLST